MNKFLKSFQFAIHGLKQVIKTELNMKLHLISAFLVIVFGFIFSIHFFEWMIILLCIGMVWSAEIFNTVIEKQLDEFHPERNKKIGLLKDMSAAAVLVISFFSLIIACLIFIPKIF